MPYFSLIIPVYNRPGEVGELLESLAQQTCSDFEVVLIEDGSTEKCDKVAQAYADKLDITYYFKPNSGRSDTRNYGMARAKGEYLVFFDSDCIIPPQYFEIVIKRLKTDYTDCYGGPDNAHESFSDMQKAINHSMTSFFTTGGIRGGKKQMEKFQPRTFNMGFSKEVYDRVGDFKDMFGEDIDLSTRIRKAGYKIALLRNAFVYHKRRVNLKQFYRQVYVFGMARISLYKLHPESLKLVHAAPAVFVIGSLALILAAPFFPWTLLLFAFYLLVLFFDSLIKNKNLKIASLSVITSIIQLVGYGFGFIKAYWEKVICRKGLESSETLKKIYK